MNYAKIVSLDGNVSRLPLSGNSPSLAKEQIPADCGWIEFHMDEFLADAGDNGYFLFPTVHEQNRPSGIARFRPRPDMEVCYHSNDMPVFGVKKGDHAFLAAVSGMGLSFSLVSGVKAGKYYMYPRFRLQGRKPYENPEIKLFELNGEDANYSGMARRYRLYQLERGACRPLRDRVKDYPVLADAVPSLEVRIRMAHKPVPSPILEQTGENEPPMTVTVTFDRAGEILDECHKQGIRHANFCLVGWNKSGHDGRFPDMFPAEPLLGGEDALKGLIAKARSYGYLISCHSNLYDSYTISKRLDRNDWLIDSDGDIHRGGNWGGGQSYLLCPEMAHNHYADADFEALKKLGFRGLHYMDCMSIMPPHPCFHPEHKLNIREAGEWRGKTLTLARESIGGSASEGELDFCIGSVDYVLYVLFELVPKHEGFVDEFVPFWFLTYHGIVLYNSGTPCVNAMMKDDPELALKNIEFGGRPLAYFYSKFLSSGAHWMGNEDLRCGTGEELRYGVEKMAEAEKMYASLCDLQYEFLEEHRMLTNEVAFTRYSDGSIIVVNYGKDVFAYEGNEIPAKSFVRF